MIELPSRFWYLKTRLRLRRENWRLRRRLQEIEDYWTPLLQAANATSDAAKIEETKKGYETAREGPSTEQVVLETQYLLMMCSRYMIAPFGPEMGDKWKVAPSGRLYLTFVERVELAARIRDARRDRVLFVVSVLGVISILATAWNAISAQTRINSLNEKVQGMQISLTALKQETADLRTLALKVSSTTSPAPPVLQTDPKPMAKKAQ